jgi:hypothetical protein
MKSTTELLLLVISLAFSHAKATELPTKVRAEPPTLVLRDLATVTSVVAQVDAGIRNLDTAVKAFAGNPAGIADASTSLLSMIRSGTTTIQASTELSLQDALNLQSIVTGLQGNAQTLVTDLAAKKAAFQQASLCDVVRQQVNDISSGSGALISAVVSKVPQAAQAIAAQLASGFTDTLAQSQAAFAQGNCTNASGSGGSGSATGTTTTTVTTTTRPTATGGGVGSGSGNATRTTALVTSTTTSAVTFTGAAAVNYVVGPIAGAALALAAMLL